MAQNPRATPKELSPIELDESLDETMEIVGVSDESATPPPTAKTGIRPVRPSSRPPSTSPVPTTPLAPKEAEEDGLDAEDLRELEALRKSIEKTALVLRAVAQLCVEKRIFTREDMRRRS